MFNVTRRFSFAITIAMMVGWGIFFLLFLASSTTQFEVQQARAENTVILPPGVKINTQVDKKVYRGGDTVLIAIRNDSRYPIWIQSSSVECPTNWWAIEKLMSDGETWSPVTLTKKTCEQGGVVSFPNHTLKSNEWVALVPGPQIGEVMVNPPAGTYRISMPYLKGKNITATTWPTDGVEKATSAAFSIL